MTTKIKREEFLSAYTNWLRGSLGRILPPEATEYRMLEIARRHHHQDILHLLQAMRKINTNEKKHISSKI